MRRSLPSDGAMNLTRDTLLPNQYPVKFYGYLQGKLGGNLVIFARKFTQKKGNSRIVKGNFTYNFTKARFPLGDFFCAKRLSIVQIEQISDQFQSRAHAKDKRKSHFARKKSPCGKRALSLFSSHRKNCFAARCEYLHLIQKNSHQTNSHCEFFLIRCKHQQRAANQFLR